MAKKHKKKHVKKRHHRGLSAGMDGLLKNPFIAGAVGGLLEGFVSKLANKLPMMDNPLIKNIASGVASGMIGLKVFKSPLMVAGSMGAAANRSLGDKLGFSEPEEFHFVSPGTMSEDYFLNENNLADNYEGMIPSFSEDEFSEEEFSEYEEV